MESHEQTTPERMPKRGRRYSPAEKEQILTDAQSKGVGQASHIPGCSDWSIYQWLK